MLLRKLAAALLVLGILLACIAALWITRMRPVLFSDPAALRKNDSYPATMAPPVPAPKLEKIPAVSATVENGELRFDVPQTNTPWAAAFGPATTLRGEPGRPVAVGNGTIELKFIGTAWSIQKTNAPDFISLPGDYYSGALEHVSAGSVEALLPNYDSKVQFGFVFPGAKLFFTRSHPEQSKVLGLEIYDGRTRQALSHGYSSSTQGEVVWFDTQAELWHQTPLEIVLYVAAGPLEIHRMPATPGAELLYSRGAIKLMGSLNGRGASTSSMYGEKTNTFRVRALGNRDASEKPETTFVYWYWPNDRLALDFEYLDRSGKPLPSMGSSISGQVMTTSIQGRPEDVKEIVVKCYPNYYRLIFHLRELPGLPEQNRGLTNLFDVRAPFLRIERADELPRVLGQLTQLEMPALALNYSNTYFPRFFTNVTMRELFDDVSQHLLSPEERLVVDPKENKVLVKRPLLLVLWEKVRKRFGL
jgi:hypothetical protein